MKRTGLWPQLGLFLVLTVGAALAWGVAAGFFATMWQTHLSNSGRAALYEDLTVGVDGQPLIGAYSLTRGIYTRLPYRTLDGDTIETDSDETIEELMPASLASAPEPRRWYDGPRTWNERLTWVSDGRMAPTYWRLVRDATDEGLSYLVGYDFASRMCVGYLGRSGFRGSAPPQREQFALGPEGINYFGGANLAGTGLAGVYRVANAGGDMPNWRMYLIDGERVVEVDLRKRNVRTLLESSDVVSLGILYRLRPNGEGAENRNGAKLAARLAVRMADRIEVLNPAGEERASFPLPEEFRQEKGLTAYQVGDEQLLLVRGGRNPYQRMQRLTWLDTQGKATREHTLTLAGYEPPSDRELATITMSVAPIPMAFTSLIALQPLSKVQMGQAENYNEGLAQMVRAAWPPYVLLLAVCAAAAWAVARRQRTHGWPHTAVWCAAVFLSGVPGLIAYLLEHRREARAMCPSCGRVVPRKRETCASCGGAFPEPRLTGVEVFA